MSSSKCATRRRSSAWTRARCRRSRSLGARTRHLASSPAGRPLGAAKRPPPPCGLHRAITSGLGGAVTTDMPASTRTRSGARAGDALTLWRSASSSMIHQSSCTSDYDTPRRVSRHGRNIISAVDPAGSGYVSLSEGHEKIEAARASAVRSNHGSAPARRTARAPLTCRRSRPSPCARGATPRSRRARCSPSRAGS